MQNSNNLKYVRRNIFLNFVIFYRRQKFPTVKQSIKHFAVCQENKILSFVYFDIIYFFGMSFYTVF